MIYEITDEFEFECLQQARNEITDEFECLQQARNEITDEFEFECLQQARKPNELHQSTSVQIVGSNRKKPRKMLLVFYQQESEASCL